MQNKVDHFYTGPKDGVIYENMANCDQNGLLMVHSSKMYPTDDCTFFQVSAQYINDGRYYNFK